MPRLLTRPGPPLDQSFEINPASLQARGLVAWWSMLGAGSSGVAMLNYAGSRSPQILLNGQPYVNDGTLGRALDYNGSSYASTATTGAVPTFQETTPFSVAFWFATSTSNAGPMVVNYSLNTTAGWQADVNAGSVRFLLLNAAATAGRGARTTSTAMAGGALTHCVCVYSGNSNSSGISIYINGFLVAVTSVLNTAPGTLIDNGVFLGYNVASLYTGRLAGDVRVYNRVITAAEAFQMYAPQTRWELYRPAKWRTIVRNPAVQYTISPTGTVTPAGALVNKDGKVLVGTVTPAGTLAKQVAKLLSGTLTPTGTLVKQLGKILSGTVTPAGALLTLKVGLVSLAGTLTPAGVLVKQAGKILAGSITPVGILVKLIGKVLTGTMTPAGALAVLKVGLVSMAGTLTPTGALVKRAGKVLAGAITPTGVLATKASFNRVFTGTLTPAGTLVKQLGKLLVGTLTPTGALAKQAGKALAGTITPAGALVKQGRKILTGTLTPTGALAKQGRKTLAGAMTPTGAFGALKVTLLALAGTLTPAGTLAKFVSKVFSGAWSAAGNVLATRFAGLTVATTPPDKKVSIQTNGRADPAAVSVQTDIRRVS